MPFNRLHRRAIAIALALGGFAGAALAVDPFTVRDIRVEGLQRVEAGTIFASLPVRVGDTYDDQKGAQAIQAIFALGLFKDVRIEASGDVLVVIVEERPTVADVEFSGNKEFDKDVLRRTMRDVGLADGRPFDRALLDRAEQEIKRQYINRSLYASEVVTTVTPIERNRVNLAFTITEGDRAKIKEIRIVGNKVFSESTLRDLFDLDTGGWLSWYTKSDQYSRAKLNADIESLRSYYLTRGYLEFRIDSTQVVISPDKQEMSIGINVTEGERYVVSAVKLDGNYLGKDDEFKSLVTIRPGQAYNANDVINTTKAFTDYFGNFGYAFARVEARPEVDRVNNRVTLVIEAEPSRRAYVRRVSVAGNNRTRDEVVRREFRQFESAWYDADKIRQVARPGRPSGVLPRSVDRNQRNRRCTGPGRPDDHGGGKGDRQPQPRGRLFQRGRSRPDGRHQAGKRIRFGKLTGRAVRYQQSQPYHRLQYDRPLFHRRRGIPGDRCLPSQYQPLQRHR